MRPIGRRDRKISASGHDHTPNALIGRYREKATEILSGLQHSYASGNPIRLMIAAGPQPVLPMSLAPLTPFSTEKPGLHEVNFVANPVHAALGAVARLRVSEV